MIPPHDIALEARPTATVIDPSHRVLSAFRCVRVCFAARGSGLAGRCCGRDWRQYQYCIPGKKNMILS